MELLNATGMKAAYTMGLKPDGRELLVVVVKGTFTIPTSERQAPALAREQADFVMADEFTGEPGFSAPKYESDFAPVKPRCDILLNGSAYAPGGEPVKRLRVGLQVGSWQKTFTVVGDRVWRKWLAFIWATAPRPFAKMPVSYDNAFGGVDKSYPNPENHKFYPTNHAGRGFHRNLKAALHGKPLPNTEENGRRVRWPRSVHRPMAFGPVGRAWEPRPKFAGTYDQKWLDNVFPFLPSDFDERYYQSAPADQQTDYLRGGEPVSLMNLTPQGRTNFKLPTVEVPITIYTKAGAEVEIKPLCDTLILEPDLGRFMMLWRAALPLKKNIFEIEQVIAGRMPRAFYRAREQGKTWFPSLAALVEARQQEREAGEEDESAEDLASAELAD